jgi:hypothetical protein
MFTEILTVLVGVFKFWDDVKAFIAFRQRYTTTEWENEGSTLTKAIQGATTDEERAKLIKALSSHCNSA